MSDLEDKSPGAAFEIFLKNESLMEKLKLLDFETQFVQKGLRLGLIQYSYPMTHTVWVIRCMTCIIVYDS